jgi:outer membrane protein insertion porin family/translocation and assembly module TamA
LYFAPASGGDVGRIYCASPAVSDTVRAAVSSCPATFRPPRGTGVLSRLVFHFGLGQAF